MLVILSCMTIGARGALELSSLLSNNMVLQRETTVKLWGTANAFARISATCSWDNHTYSAKTDQNGNWSMEVQTPEAGGPYTIEFSNMTGGDKITLRNVMIGEVWICSGQSNMVHPIRGYAAQPVNHTKETLAEADQKFHPAQARIIDGSNRVEVWSDEVAEPVALRYAFRNYCLVSLYDKHGLTPRPYRTDCWDSVR